ncbi:MAG: PDZ domain-containing protein [Planctomycetota bacterium]
MSAKACVRYRISIPRPSDHFVHVTMEIDDAPEGLVVAMPVWTPGSYLVREFSRHVSGVTAARVSGDPVGVEKIEKNRWLIDAKPGKRVDVSYRVYANELTVRTSHVDADHAFLHPAGTYLFVEGREAERVTVAVEAPEGWRTATQLPLTGEATYTAENLDALLDAPLEIGTHQVLTFEVGDVPHRIALYGEGNFDRDELLGDTATICHAATEMFAGDHPSASYTFIYHVLEGAGGGLEHLDSSVCGFAPFSFRPERKYRGALSLISHEYFHLWNVKRIRPRELGPFDYQNENYTRLLWVAEGFTSYYQDRILLAADLLPVPEFLDNLARMIRVSLETPGRLVDPVAESSFDSWIKLYRPHEGIRNATISYYLKGALVALLLDLTIREATEGERSLDDVMRALWAQYRARPGEGYTEEELLGFLEEAAGRSLADEIAAWVHTTEELPFEAAFAAFGLELVPEKADEEPKAYLGVTTKKDGGKVKVREVLAGTPAEAAGLAADDELVAIDGWRLGDLKERLAERAPGDEVALTIARRSRLRKIVVTAGEAPDVDRVLRPIEDADDRARNRFLGWTGADLATAAEKPAPPPKSPRPRPI